FLGYTQNYCGCLRQRLAAALRAIDCRFLGVSLAARALPPFAPPALPRATAWGFFSVLVSSTSPVAIRPTMTAAPITSAGRFSPWGPLGILVSRHGGSPFSPPAICADRPYRARAALFKLRHHRRHRQNE